MLKSYVVAACLAVGAGTAAFASSVGVKQSTRAQERRDLLRPLYRG